MSNKSGVFSDALLCFCLAFALLLPCFCFAFALLLLCFFAFALVLLCIALLCIALLCYAFLCFALHSNDGKRSEVYVTQCTVALRLNFRGGELEGGSRAG